MKNLTTKKKLTTLGKVFLFVGLTVYVVALVYLSHTINVSEDETYTLKITALPLFDLIKESYKFEQQPPLYFLLLSAWRHLDNSLFFMKLFSLICIGAASIFYYRTAALIKGADCGRWLLLIFLLNPFTVWAALEMRTYALLILISSLSGYFFYRYLFQDSKKSLYWLLLVSLAGLYTQYFFLFIVIAFGLSVWIFKGWKRFLVFTLYFVPVILLFIPNLVFLPSQMNVMKISRGPGFSRAQLLNMLETPRDYLLAINYIGNGWTNRLIRLFFYLSAILIYLKLGIDYYLYRNYDYFKKFNVLFFSSTVIVTLFCISFYISKIEYAYKYMSILYPLLLLLLTIFGNYPRHFRNFIYLAMSLYFLILLLVYYWHPVKTYDFNSAASYVEKIEHPDEPILVYRPAIANAFVFSYKGKNPIIPIPYPVQYDSSYLISIKDTSQLEKSIEKSAPASSFILLSDTTSFENNVNMNRSMITRYLDSHYEVAIDTFFLGWGKQKALRIREFHKK